MHARLTSVTGAALVLTTTLTGCDSHAPVGGIPAAPTYSTSVRAIPTCPASVHVPAAVSGATPKPVNGPTAVLRLGDAVTVPVPPGSVIGLTGMTDADERSVLCQVRAAGRAVTLVARSRGYVRVGVVAPHATRPALVFADVTG